MIHKNWKSSGGGWKMRPEKWKFGRGFLPISSPAADTENTPQKLPTERKNALC